MVNDIELSAIKIREINSYIPGFDCDIFMNNNTKKNINTGIGQAVLTILRDEVPSEIVFIDRNWNNNHQTNIQVSFKLSRELIQSIEYNRTDDVPMNIRVEFIGFCSDEDGKFCIQSFSAFKDIKHSQKEWLDRLKKIGYKDSWIIEIDRPSIEGMDAVYEHLQNAQNKIQTRNFEDALGECRIAWNSLTPLIKGIKEKIQTEIDRNSKGEKDYPPKSQRLDELMNNIKLWSQIGIHRESYCVTPEDALLAYRTTVSIIAYLSTHLREIAKEIQMEGGKKND